jgi:hypothetical protein
MSSMTNSSTVPSSVAMAKFLVRSLKEEVSGTGDWYQYGESCLRLNRPYCIIEMLESSKLLESSKTLLLTAFIFRLIFELGLIHRYNPTAASQFLL